MDTGHNTVLLIRWLKVQILRGAPGKYSNIANPQSITEYHRVSPGIKTGCKLHPPDAEMHPPPDRRRPLISLTLRKRTVPRLI
ncbi:hypothetical protein MBAV_003085 [Candidatus Magnetobacterium bavaricum]|uniref:Uncharacterized protein n=1 Tax=Candidatus Magnetobacterium bavaricum TaxID=29290 RepID=A0A0F3GS45_9BACT|nr:hypothetical protein MBAV_003085 [Candidatus Magnetobacterium bavaricum]